MEPGIFRPPFAEQLQGFVLELFGPRGLRGAARSLCRSLEAEQPASRSRASVGETKVTVAGAGGALRRWGRGQTAMVRVLLPNDCARPGVRGPAMDDGQLTSVCEYLYAKVLETD